MANGKKGVKYTFTGEYFTGSKEHPEQIKKYELDVVFPEETKIALSIFKTSLSRTKDFIFKMMLEKYPDFKAVRTYMIANVENLADANKLPSNIASMNTKQLTKYIEDKKLGIDVNVFDGDLAKLRTYIELAEKDAEAFKVAYEEEVKAYELNSQLANLNGGQDGGEDNGKDGEDTQKDGVEEILG